MEERRVEGNSAESTAVQRNGENTSCASAAIPTTACVSDHPGAEAATIIQNEGPASAESSLSFSSESESEVETPQQGTSGWLDNAKSVGNRIMGRIRGTEQQQSDRDKATWKNRLQYAWNGMKYSGRLLTNHSSDYAGEHQVVLLGRFYYPEQLDPVLSFDQFFLDYYSRIWLTYRSGFEPFPGTSERSDCGWGCMLRSSQMMVAQAIVLYRLGRDWRWHRRKTSNVQNEDLSASIIRLFDDSPNAQLGLHRLMQISAETTETHKIGRWFTPSEALNLLQRALSTSSSPQTAGLCSVVCVDGRVIVHALERETRQWTRGLVLFVCVRLGTHSVNKVYHRHIRYILSLPNSLGIAGGKPNHSLLFIGFYDQQLIYLDPHVAHPYVSSDNASAQSDHHSHRHPLSSFHCKLMSKMPLSDMDPSCALGFYFSNKEEFDDTMKTLNLNQVIDVELGLGLGSKRTRDPLFAVLHEEPPEYAIQSTSSEWERQQAEEHGYELI